MTPVITQRLILQEMTRDDAPGLARIWKDPDTMKYYSYAFDDDRVQDWIERNIQRQNTFGFSLWTIRLKDTGEIIGDCGLTMQNINGRIRPEIGYHIRADHQQCGYAKEAAQAVRDWTFEHTPFQEIYSYLVKANIPSAKTAQSYGARLVEEYEHPDPAHGTMQVYRITKTEWLTEQPVQQHISKRKTDASQKKKP